MIESLGHKSYGNLSSSHVVIWQPYILGVAPRMIGLRTNPLLAQIKLAIAMHSRGRVTGGAFKGWAPSLAVSIPPPPSAPSSFSYIAPWPEQPEPALVYSTFCCCHYPDGASGSTTSAMKALHIWYPGLPVRPPSSHSQLHPFPPHPHVPSHGNMCSPSPPWACAVLTREATLFPLTTSSSLHREPMLERHCTHLGQTIMLWSPSLSCSRSGDEEKQMPRS